MLSSPELAPTVPDKDQQQKLEQKLNKGSGPTIRIMLQKPRSTSSRRNTEPAAKVSTSSRSQSASQTQLNHQPEPAELVEALANPLLYQRPVLLPALQGLIHSLEVVHSCIESYAAGEFMTDQPITLGLKRVSNAWSTFIAPLNSLNGLPTADGSAKGIEWTEEEEKKRKSVGRKLLALAVEKQRCISACECHICHPSLSRKLNRRDRQ
jgi:hypothetical protein